MQNNRIHHREWYDKIRQQQSDDQGGKEGIVAGFEYAVQHDGISLGEMHWQTRRSSTAMQFEFTCYTAPEKRYQTSLQSIKSSVTASSQRYQKQSILPKGPKDSSSYMNSSAKLPTHPVGPAFLSPTRRIRNRHNAVYGQHLPNALNSPGCSMKVFGKIGMQHEEHHRIENLLNGNNNDNISNSAKENPPTTDLKPTNDMGSDVDDAFLYEIDIDQLIAQRIKYEPSTQSRKEDFDSRRTDSASSDSIQPNSILTNSISQLSTPRSVISSRNPYQKTSHGSARYPIMLNHEGDGKSDKMPGPEVVCLVSASSKDSNSVLSCFGGGNSSFNSGNSALVNGGSYLSTTNDSVFTNGHDSSRTVSSTSSVTRGLNSTTSPLMIGHREAPLCPGHNLPCRVLKSNTSTNTGRKFFKCCMSEGFQCDFFEWIDGQEGNRNNSCELGGFTEISYNDGQVLDIYQENRRKFGHSSFRPGQRDVIEHAMQGKDVFVLMPTGGGKSLCYQLPAWCSPGIAIVISPLLSLIQDQVQSLTKLGVESVFLNSAQDYETEQKNITSRLFQATNHGGIKLLYITPEKLRHSNMTQNILMRLYEKKLLSRFVVDEAHCMSDWAHDFRPDYGRLGMLRQEFPNVPIMALTATANEKVVNDAIRALGMRNEYRFKSSFNRPNLHYEVRKKDSKSIEKIGEYIVGRPQDSGVIYCLSRKDCETVSEALQQKLNEKGFGHVRVSFYHAELDDQERTCRHHAWSSGKISVLCATIAFGMGIDKPDVRFVIHFSMPKSITHYYQESGRAGRDGAKADCILYYAYKDKKVLETMIRNGSKNPNSESSRRKIDQLYTCLRYCENEFICRRTMQLEFFGENFDKSKCGKTCDNCRSGLKAERRNLTSVACQMLQLLQDVSTQKNGRGVTLLQLTDLFKGSKSKSATKFLNVSRLIACGAGKMYSKSDLDRITHAMIYDKILMETGEQTGGGYNVDYIHPGENASVTQSGQRPFFVEFPVSVAKVDATQPGTTKKKPTPKKAPSKVMETQKTGPSAYTTAGSLSVSDWEISDESGKEEGEAGEDVTRKVGSKAAAALRVLPLKMTQALVVRIKKLVGMWADEEQMNGNRVFCKCPC